MHALLFLLPVLCHAAAPAPSCGTPPAAGRVDCGSVGTTQASCEAGGCCWSPLSPNPHNEPWCFVAPPTPAPPTPSPGPPGPLTATLRVHYPDAMLRAAAAKSRNTTGHAAAAAALYVRGEGCAALSWAAGLPLEHTGADLWTAQLAGLNAGDQLSLKALVNDDVWAVGANAAFTVPPAAGAAAFAGASAATDERAAPALDYYPWFISTAGRYEYVRDVHSAQLGNRRDIVVYLPPSYDENTLKPCRSLLLMHDGENVFNDSTSAFGVSWRAAPTVDALIVEGVIGELVIGALDNTAARMFEYTYSDDHSAGYCASPGDCAGAEQYLDFLEQTALPLLTSRYRFVRGGGSAGELDLGILGSSLGGLVSCYAAWTRAGVYNRAGCMSSSFWWNGEDFNNTILASPPSRNGSATAQRTAIYLDSGDSPAQDDDQHEPGDDKLQTLRVRRTLEQSYGYELGADLWYYLDPGGEHGEPWWGARFHVPMTALYGGANLRN